VSAPACSLVLLTKNGGPVFAETLRVLAAQQGIERAEVVLIDSGSTDGTPERAAEVFPEARIHRIPPAEFGHGRTRNLGARLATAPLLVYLVQDATPVGADFLERLTAPLADPTVAAAYGRQIARPEADPVERFYLEAVYPDRPESRAWNGGRMTIRTMFFSNVAAVLRRSVWERFPFEEEILMSEDQQWAKAALRDGHRIVYEPAAAVLHSHHYTLEQVFRRNFDSGASLVGVAEDTLGEMIGYELAHLRAGLRHFAAHRQLGQIPRFLAYEATRAAAFSTGQRARWIPLPLKRKLSLYRYHWDRPQTK
jgi:rhamnosyltransferase